MSNIEQVRSSQLSEIWRPRYDLRDAEVEQQGHKAPPTHQQLQALLQRGVQHFSDDMRVTVEVKGIYGLPEEWTSKIVSTKLNDVTDMYPLNDVG